MTKSAWGMRAMLGVVLVPALFAAPRPAEAKFEFLKAPKTTGTYYLTRKDRYLQVVLDGWYCAKTDFRLEIEKEILDPLNAPEDAEKIIRKLNTLPPRRSSTDHSWDYEPPSQHRTKKRDGWKNRWPFTDPSMVFEPSKTLFVPPGGRKVYKRKYCSTKKELQTVQKTVFTFLEAMAKRKWGKKARVAYMKALDWTSLRTDFSHTITIIAYRGLCHPAAAQRARTLMEKLGRLRQAFLLEEDRQKKDAISRQMRTIVKGLAAAKKKIEENIKIEKQKCARENRQAVRQIDDWIKLDPLNLKPVRNKSKRTTKTARADAMPGRESAAGCRFSKPRPAGQGRPGLAGFPESFPRPPGLKSGWTLPTSDGMLYLLGVSGGVRSMVRFVKKALPVRGWRITGTKTTRNPGAKSDSVHIFFRNRVYCGWVTIGRGTPAPTYMNVLLKKHGGRVGGG